MLVEQWFEPYGAPKQVHSDEDVRIRSDTGWYRRVLNALNVEVTTGVPYTHTSNPLCERQNRVLEQNLRILMKQERTKDWVCLVPWAVLTMKSQRSSSAGFTPHELFHGGRPAWFFKTRFPEDFKSPVGDWLEHKQSLANQAGTNLRHVRDRELSRRNRLRRPASFKVGDLVLVHHSRLPSWPRNCLQDPYFGPYRIISIDGSRIPGWRTGADTSPCGSEHVTPGSRACLRVLVLPGRVGRAGLPGAFWCASPFPLAALSLRFAGPPPGWGCPCFGPLFALTPPLLLLFCCCFFFSSSVRPHCLWLSLVCSPWCPGTRRCVLFVFLGLPLPGSPCALALCVSPAWPLAAPWWLPPPPPPLPSCVSRLSSLLLGVLFFFSFFLPLCAPVVSGFLWFPAPGALGLSAVCCLLCWPAASRLSVRSRLFRVSRLAVGCSLVVAAPPPPPFVSRGFRRCRSGLCAVCCAVLNVPGCAAAPRCCALCRPVLCCRVLCCFVALVWCRCLLRRALWRCPSPWGPVLCGAVLCGVPPRCVLCAACVLSWRGGACCCLPLCFVLCVSRGAVLCVPCPLSSVRCCASLCWCACVVLFVWCVLLLAPGAVVRCCELCCFLWCAVVRCWVWWPVVVCWWHVPVSVSLSGRVVCFPVVGVVCCGALLPCVVFCGAVLSRGAVLLFSAVVLWCCWGLLCPPVACRAVLCCAVGCLCCFLPGGGVCVLCCSFPRAVCSLFSPLCALRCLVVLAVVPCFPVSCAVALCCRVVLCCRVLLSFCGAVCVCFALLWPVVRRRAVLCCAVGCLCCFLPGGGVCALWYPFPPCRHAQKTSIILRVTPRWWRCRGWHALLVAVSWT